MKDWEEEKKILFIENQMLPKEMEAVKTKLPLELERLYIYNDNLNKYWESKIKNCELEKKILVNVNQVFQKKLVASKTNVPVEIL